ncbi:MAG: NAD-dependent epimerase/dehydratase family protein [Ferrimicrobium sp.]|jgi:UDP-glucose 4-epimerase|uniref:NAD-dependent epimerase/dehydratase family protein n=1 Tax=Ferrimicrobium acidiphilum TaxID=121039 RepID=A0ABV3XZ42_9ACTN|nr:NAD-dependent epimerase/dehydratase family protein [Ferrimicrobium sp.]MCL5973625.1 NAD-dependent epimerase/dehydratase family protein [Actinomycetota bacterium]
MAPPVLVTGGAGFIGSHLVERLIDAGYEVDVVDNLSTGSLANLRVARGRGNRGLHFHKLDIVDGDLAALMGRRQPMAVIHLAARADVRESMLDPLGDLSANLVGSLRVLEAARHTGVSKVIFATSAGVYGAVDASELPIREDVVHVPDSFYGLSKDAVLGYLRLYRDNFDLEYTALILANVYGPRQGMLGEGGVVAKFAQAIASGSPATIIGDGSQTRDLIYVDDVVDAFYRSLEQGGGLTLNIATGIETSIATLHKEMYRIAGCDYRDPRYVEAVPGEIMRSSLDARRAGWYLRWHAATPLERGLEKVLDWYGALRRSSQIR